jgi:hypothetical protein
MPGKNTRVKKPDKKKEFERYDAADWVLYKNGFKVLNDGKKGDNTVFKPTNLSTHFFYESDKNPNDSDSDDSSSDEDDGYEQIKQGIEEKSGEKVDSIKFLTDNPGLAVVCFAAGACMLYKIIKENTGGKKHRKTRRKNKYTRSKHI